MAGRLIPSVAQLNTRRFESFQRSSRNGQKILRLQLHHGATTNAVWMRDVMVSGSKQVSANSICTADGELWEIVPKGFRAWTSGDADYDRGSYTVETANLSANGWTISNASHEKLAQLAAALAVENGWGRLNRSGPFSTWNVVGHREINQFLGRSYATACPGAMDLDRIVRRANEILAQGVSIPTFPAPAVNPITEAEIVSFIDALEDDDMTIAHFVDSRSGKTEQQFVQASVLGGVTAWGGGVSPMIANRIAGRKDDAPIPVYSNEECDMFRNQIATQQEAALNRIAEHLRGADTLRDINIENKIDVLLRDRGLKAPEPAK